MTANTHDLAFRRSSAQRWFLALADATDDAELARVRVTSGDPQGYYVAGPDGQSHGWINDADPADLHRFLNRALQHYRAHPPRPVQVSAAEKAEPWSQFPAPTTAVVRVFSRIRPLPREVWGLNRGVGRDFLWIYGDELEALATAAGPVGQTVTLPPSLVRRLARYHLLDEVRGTPNLWGPHEVGLAEATARVASEEGTVARVDFTLRFAMRARRRQQGYRGHLDGSLEIDRRSGALRRFRAFAAGTAWGAGTWTPQPPPGEFRLLVAMLDAHDEVARQIPPEAVSTHRDDREYHRPP